MGISTKTSAICGLIVLLLLLINGLIFLGLESSLVESIFKEYASNVSEALDAQELNRDTPQLVQLIRSSTN